MRTLHEHKKKESCIKTSEPDHTWCHGAHLSQSVHPAAPSATELLRQIFQQATPSLPLYFCHPCWSVTTSPSYYMWVDVGSPCH